MKRFLIFIAALGWFSCENSESDIKALSGKKIQKDESIKVESFLSQGGVVKARLTAPVMLRVMAQMGVDTPYVEFPKKLHVDFYNEQKMVESRLDSKYGRYFESLNKVYLRDSVKVISIKGDTLTCDDLWWDQSQQKFYTDKPAKLRSPDNFIDAKFGLEATQDFKDIKFKEVKDSRILTEEGAVPSGQ
ncbi:LPS export ABC transporter periplasmic protein LptC [Niabella yanshanensis]|uniref:LPS export ABC transporter periplasmic protein LptC n=1 Tax=Niabella yanshanensis TaxID=577386 RepID=A0ABZ0W2G2_9BACT|nr:LPS export ABC transporter periplasmic protein LptC [Niabella yanshanensis]WQD36904.1 LPS export ABC transporter periplasmic protein LptC [Niabella yanshanensis]